MTSIFADSFKLEYESHLKFVIHTDFTTSIETLAKQQITPQDAARRTEDIFQNEAIPLRSLFDRLIRTGASLGSEDSDVVSKDVRDLEAQLDPLIIRISEALSTIGQLCNDVSEASIHLAQKRNQIRLGRYLLSQKSPAQLLPQDVLERILLTSFYANTSTKPDIQTAPLQVAAVCKWWRHIALSTQALWKFIRFTAPYQKTIPCAKLWAQRCRLPYVTAHIHSPGDYLSQLLTLLRDPSIQLRGLEMGCNYSNAQELTAALRTCNLNELEEIHILDNADRPDFTFPLPNLKRFYCYPPITFWTASPPPPQLTDLVLNASLHPSFAEYIFIACPCLQRIVIAVGERGIRSAESVSESQRPATIVLPDLVVFGLRSYTDDGGFPLDTFNSVSFPKLVSFEYFVESGLERQGLIEWLLARSFLPQIRHLTLHIPNITSDSYVSIISATRSLEDLCLHCPRPILQDILFSLTQIPSSASTSIQLVPNLRTLHIMTNIPISAWGLYLPPFKELATARSGRLTSLRFSYLGDSTGTVSGARQFINAIKDFAFPVELPLKWGFVQGTFIHRSIPRIFQRYRLPLTQTRKYTVFQEGMNTDDLLGPTLIQNVA